MVKYRIEYKREACIGAAVCAAYAPDDWEMADEDGLADLTEAKKEGEVWVKFIEAEDLEKNKLAAECCPARVIKIVNEETGKVLVEFDND